MGDRITLRVPAEKKYALAARMTSKSIAAAAGASVYVVEDVHSAIEEVFVQGYAHCREGGYISFEFTVIDHEMITRAWVSEVCSHKPVDYDETLSMSVLESFCDEFALDAGEIWALTMRHSLNKQDS